MKMVRPRSRRPRRGFSLIEVIVAMTLLSVVFISLGGMMIKMSQRSHINDVIAKRTAALTQEANRFNALPYDSLYNDKVSMTDKVLTMGDFKFTRKLTLTKASATRLSVAIKLVPYNPTYSSYTDSVVVYRTKPAGSPLCVGC
jgi:prepilin-type N-terminal cleavage/methylation domain-containing protein